MQNIAPAAAQNGSFRRTAVAPMAERPALGSRSVNVPPPPPPVGAMQGRAQPKALEQCVNQESLIPPPPPPPRAAHNAGAFARSKEAGSGAASASSPGDPDRHCRRRAPSCGAAPSAAHAIKALHKYTYVKNFVVHPRTPNLHEKKLRALMERSTGSSERRRRCARRGGKSSARLQPLHGGVSAKRSLPGGAVASPGDAEEVLQGRDHRQRALAGAAVMDEALECSPSACVVLDFDLDDGPPPQHDLHSPAQIVDAPGSALPSASTSPADFGATVLSVTMTADGSCVSVARSLFSATDNEGSPGATESSLPGSTSPVAGQQLEGTYQSLAQRSCSHTGAGARDSAEGGDEGEPAPMPPDEWALGTMLAPRLRPVAEVGAPAIAIPQTPPRVPHNAPRGRPTLQALCTTSTMPHPKAEPATAAPMIEAGVLLGGRARGQRAVAVPQRRALLPIDASLHAVVCAVPTRAPSPILDSVDNAGPAPSEESGYPAGAHADRCESPLTSAQGDLAAAITAYCAHRAEHPASPSRGDPLAAAVEAAVDRAGVFATEQLLQAHRDAMTDAAAAFLVHKCERMWHAVEARLLRCRLEAQRDLFMYHCSEALVAVARLIEADDREDADASGLFSVFSSAGSAEQRQARVLRRRQRAYARSDRQRLEAVAAFLPPQLSAHYTIMAQCAPLLSAGTRLPQLQRHSSRRSSSSMFATGHRRDANGTPLPAFTSL